MSESAKDHRSRPLDILDVPRDLAYRASGIIAEPGTYLHEVCKVVASMQPGAVSQLFYADRLYELPLAIVGIAVGVVLLPDVARQLRAGNEAGAVDSQNRALEFAMLLTVPAAVALAVVPGEIVQVLFERGAFTASDTANTSAVLAVFALGLPAFVLIKVLSPAYFAREDTKTPMRYAVISLTANTLGSIALFFLFRRLGWLPHLGIAVATAVGGWLNAMLLWVTLIARGHFALDRPMLRSLAKIGLASAVMGIALFGVARLLADWFGRDQGFLVNLAALAGLIGTGFAVYALAVLATGALRIGQLRKALRRS